MTDETKKDVFDVKKPYTLKCKNGHVHVFNYPNISQLEIFERMRAGTLTFRDGFLEPAGDAVGSSLKLWDMLILDVQRVENFKTSKAIAAVEKVKTVELLFDNINLTEEEVRRYGTEHLVEVEAGSETTVLYLRSVYENAYFLSVHTMRLPNETHLAKYQEAVARAKTKGKKNKVVSVPGNTIRDKVEIYDDLLVTADGYKDADPASIPIPHKLEIVEALINIAKEDIFDIAGN